MKKTSDQYAEFFFEMISKKIDSTLKSLLEKMDSANLKKKKMKDQLSGINNEIEVLNNNIQSLRKQAVSEMGHKEAVGQIIEKREQIRTLEEIKEEITSESIPSADQICLTAKRSYIEAVNNIIIETARKYQAELNACHLDMVNKINGFEAALYLISSEKLKLSHKDQYRLNFDNRPFLAIKDVELREL